MKLAPMSVPRANPACSLVDMEDGEVTFSQMRGLAAVEANLRSPFIAIENVAS
jgi:hypothetical protein